MAVSGTSMPVPHVTGAASLIWQKDASVSAEFVRTLLRESAKTVEGRDEGILDVAYALEQYDRFKENYIESNGVGENSEKTVDSKAGNRQTAENVIEENSSKVETFDTDKLVEGSWMKSAHQKSVMDGLANTDLFVDVSVIRKFVDEADKEAKLKDGSYSEGKYNYRDTKGLHVVETMWLICSIFLMWQDVWRMERVLPRPLQIPNIEGNCMQRRIVKSPGEKSKRGWMPQ